MSMIRSFSFVVVAAVVSTFAVGCSNEVDDASSSTDSRVTLSGRVDGGGSAISGRSFGGITAGARGLHVVARKLHRRGEAGGTVDVAVASDGSFRLDVTRGSRWVVTIDSADQKSAMISFGSGGKNVLAVAGGEAGGSVDLGKVKIVGGQAYADILIDGRLGLAATLAELDEVFEAANGAIADAREAVAEAQKAAAEALAAADDAVAAAEAARKAAEAAAAAAAGGK